MHQAFQNFGGLHLPRNRLALVVTVLAARMCLRAEVLQEMLFPTGQHFVTYARRQLNFRVTDRTV